MREVLKMNLLRVAGCVFSLALSADASTVNFAITNSDTTPYTGPLMLSYVGPGLVTAPVLANGTFFIGGVLQRVEMTNGWGSAQLMRGTYFASNSVVTFCFAVPLDTGIYNAASNVVSGYNLFAYIPGVTADTVSNMVAAIIRQNSGGWTNWPEVDTLGHLNNDGEGFLYWGFAGYDRWPDQNAPGQLNNDGYGSLSWARAITGKWTNWPASDSIGQLYNDGNGYLSWAPITGGWLSWPATNAPGQLNNDGYGGLSWRPTATGGWTNWPATNKPGQLNNDGNGNLSWAPAAGGMDFNSVSVLTGNFTSVVCGYIKFTNGGKVFSLVVSTNLP